MTRLSCFDVEVTGLLNCDVYAIVLSYFNVKLTELSESDFEVNWLSDSSA